MEESTSADIFSNIISENLKAGIALGGEQSGHTKIKYNHIAGGKREGIFVVEGGEQLVISLNKVTNNQKGIVLLHSDGLIDHNQILENKIGLGIAEDTVARIQNNLVEHNDVYGIEIEKTS